MYGLSLAAAGRQGPAGGQVELLPAVPVALPIEGASDLRLRLGDVVVEGTPPVTLNVTLSVDGAPTLDHAYRVVEPIVFSGGGSKDLSVELPLAGGEAAVLSSMWCLKTTRVCWCLNSSSPAPAPRPEGRSGRSCGRASTARGVVHLRHDAGRPPLALWLRPHHIPKHVRHRARGGAGLGGAEQLVVDSSVDRHVVHGPRAGCTRGASPSGTLCPATCLFWRSHCATRAIARWRFGVVARTGWIRLRAWIHAIRRCE